MGIIKILEKTLNKLSFQIQKEDPRFLRFKADDKGTFRLRGMSPVRLKGGEVVLAHRANSEDYEFLYVDKVTLDPNGAWWLVLVDGNDQEYSVDLEFDILGILVEPTPEAYAARFGAPVGTTRRQMRAFMEDLDRQGRARALSEAESEMKWQRIFSGA